MLGCRTQRHEAVLAGDPLDRPRETTLDQSGDHALTDSSTVPRLVHNEHPARRPGCCEQILNR